MLIPDHETVSTSERRRPDRPPPCRGCHGRSWWNGWRSVFAVVAGLVGAEVERVERWLPRAKCSSCRQGFTAYPAEHYPRRQYQLDVVAEVAAAVAIGGEPAAKAAARAMASPTSARRWTAWVSELAPASVLLATAQKIDPDAPVGAGVSTTAASAPVRLRAAYVLAALEQLGAALVRQGVDLVSRTGLGRVLQWQFLVHGDLVHLVVEPRCLSPTMALGTAPRGL